MKKISLIVIALLFCVCFTYAEDADGDCKLALTKDTFLSKWDTAVENTDPVQFNLNKIMPKEAMEKAFDNLKSYCCDVEKISSGSCSRTNSDVLYPESIYLFDHVLDVYLRRLDAKQKNDNGNDLLYGLDPDSSGKDWRDYITNHGDAVDGSLPVEIKEKYEKFWSGSKFVVGFSDLNGAPIDQWLVSIKGVIESNSTNTWTLFDKYNLACDVSKYISEYAINTTAIKKTTADEYRKCKTLTNARINNEKIYTQAIMSQKGDKLLGANMNAYLGTYFVSNRLANLIQILFDTSTSFAEVVNGISQLVNQCS